MDIIIYINCFYIKLCLNFISNYVFPFFLTSVPPSNHSVKLAFRELKKVKATQSVSNFLQPHGLYPSRLLCPWNSPGKNTGVGSQSLLQGIFPTQGLNPGLPQCRQILYHLSHQGSPDKVYLCLDLMLPMTSPCATTREGRGMTSTWCTFLSP